MQSPSQTTSGILKAGSQASADSRSSGSISDDQDLKLKTKMSLRDKIKEIKYERLLRAGTLNKNDGNSKKAQEKDQIPILQKFNFPQKMSFAMPVHRPYPEPVQLINKTSPFLNPSLLINSRKRGRSRTNVGSRTGFMDGSTNALVSQGSNMNQHDSLDSDNRRKKMSRLYPQKDSQDLDDSEDDDFIPEIERLKEQPGEDRTMDQASLQRIYKDRKRYIQILRKFYHLRQDRTRTTQVMNAIINKGVPRKRQQSLGNPPQLTNNQSQMSRYKSSHQQNNRNTSPKLQNVSQSTNFDRGMPSKVLQSSQTQDNRFNQSQTFQKTSFLPQGLQKQSRTQQQRHISVSQIGQRNSRPLLISPKIQQMTPTSSIMKDPIKTQAKLSQPISGAASSQSPRCQSTELFSKQNQDSKLPEVLLCQSPKMNQVQRGRVNTLYEAAKQISNFFYLIAVETANCGQEGSKDLAEVLGQMANFIEEEPFSYCRIKIQELLPILKTYKLTVQPPQQMTNPNAQTTSSLIQTNLPKWKELALDLAILEQLVAELKRKPEQSTKNQKMTSFGQLPKIDSLKSLSMTNGVASFPGLMTAKSNQLAQKYFNICELIQAGQVQVQTQQLGTPLNQEMISRLSRQLMSNEYQFIDSYNQSNHSNQRRKMGSVGRDGEYSSYISQRNSKISSKQNAQTRTYQNKFPENTSIPASKRSQDTYELGSIHLPNNCEQKNVNNKSTSSPQTIIGTKQTGVTNESQKNDCSIQVKQFGIDQLQSATKGDQDFLDMKRQSKDITLMNLASPKVQNERVSRETKKRCIALVTAMISPKQTSKMQPPHTELIENWCKKQIKQRKSLNSTTQVYLSKQPVYLNGNLDKQ